MCLWCVGQTSFRKTANPRLKSLHKENDTVMVVWWNYRFLIVSRESGITISFSLLHYLAHTQTHLHFTPLAAHPLLATAVLLFVFGWLQPPAGRQKQKPQPLLVRPCGHRQTQHPIRSDEKRKRCIGCCSLPVTSCGRFTWQAGGGIRRGPPRKPNASSRLFYLNTKEWSWLSHKPPTR